MAVRPRVLRLATTGRGAELAELPAALTAAIADGRWQLSEVEAAMTSQAVSEAIASDIADDN